MSLFARAINAGIAGYHISAAMLSHSGTIPARTGEAVKIIQEFSFKGYDQQPPGFSKPGFFVFHGIGSIIERYPPIPDV